MDLNTLKIESLLSDGLDRVLLVTPDACGWYTDSDGRTLTAACREGATNLIGTTATMD